MGQRVISPLRHTATLLPHNGVVRQRTGCAAPAYHEQDLVFATAIGTPVDPSNLRRAWRSIVKRPKIGHPRFPGPRHALRCRSSLRFAWFVSVKG